MHRAVFIVRRGGDDLGRFTGVVERVRSGQKTRVEGIADISAAIEAMLARADAEDPRVAERDQPP